jgi:hypothetical protein
MVAEWATSNVMTIMQWTEMVAVPLARWSPTNSATVALLHLLISALPLCAAMIKLVAPKVVMTETSNQMTDAMRLVKLRRDGSVRALLQCAPSVSPNAATTKLKVENSVTMAMWPTEMAAIASAS